jgi:type VI secretion system protein ImpF
MARVDKTKKLRPSIVDRLLDDDPHNQAEADPGQHQLLKQLRDSVRRDLESLLNTRYHILQPPEELHEVEKSIMNYGLPDLATINIVDTKKRNEFAERLQRTLVEFEPRFKTVKVTYLDNKDTTDRTLRFRIDAVMYADPLPQVIVFDSILESVTRTVRVKEI